VVSYFRLVKEVCHRYGVLLILDDVMSGMGRTGHLFSHIEDGIRPDVVAIGKGLAAGYQPISAVAIAGPISDAIASGSGVLQNGQTHVNHPLACAIALEVQKTIEEDNLLENVRARGEQMRRLLREALAEYDFVGDVRGRGLLIGVEFVENRESKAPLQGGGGFVDDLKRMALEQGLLIYPGSGTADGKLGNHVMFAPPFVSDSADIAEMVDRFARLLKLPFSAIHRR
jgi:adenosylmethionine-8-amino-7-oxononanoate aminotransferase